ncbi:energy transducer TonB [Sphingosinicella terrae]|uniref:energy transducer TonB n=1 Tax=Sphingosinicella terrae TaxID=2172047 RepID=UPI000E0CCC47|nr:energy transducer TonB [Sphingosinicella terrae]
MPVASQIRLNRKRVHSALAVALLHGLIAWLLVTGLRFEPPTRSGSDLKLFDVAEPPPPAELPSIPAEAPSEAESGAAAPPALEAEPIPVAAPEPVVPVPRPHLPAAPVAGEGAAPSAGGAPAEGPGTGAGGAGIGTGAGAGGTGGGAGGLSARARHVGGRIRNRDYPRSAVRARAQGEVFARLRIDADGRVTDCRIARSSGHEALDAATCRLILERFRFEPARDGRGDPVPDVGGWLQRWWLEGD